MKLGLVLDNVNSVIQRPESNVVWAKWSVSTNWRIWVWVAVRTWTGWLDSHIMSEHLFILWLTCSWICAYITRLAESAKHFTFLKFSHFLCKVIQFARLPLWSTSKRTRVPVEIWTLLSQHYCQCLFTNEIGQCCAELFRSININNSSSFSTTIGNSISNRNSMQHHQEWKDFKVFVKNKVTYWHFQFLSPQEPKINPNGGRVANWASTP